MKGRDILIYLSTKYEGDWDKTFAAVKAHEPLPFDAQTEAPKEPECGTLTIIDQEYPDELRHSEKPAIVLYYYGDIGLLKAETKIGYVGSREASAYGLRTAEALGTEIAKRGYVLVNGLARGIEGTAVKAALDAGGKAIAVLGNGVDFCYPSENAEIYERLKTQGLLISEYPLGANPTARSFPMRDRIIAGLCKALIVGEASRRSGALITVAYALSGGKDVGCVPYHADEQSACNDLIAEGTMLVQNGTDLDALVGKTKAEDDGKKEGK